MNKLKRIIEETGQYLSVIFAVTGDYLIIIWEILKGSDNE